MVQEVDNKREEEDYASSSLSKRSIRRMSIFTMRASVLCRGAAPSNRARRRSRYRALAVAGGKRVGVAEQA